MAYPEEKRAIVSLFTDVFAETTELFQAEINLVRSEIRQSVDRVANSGTLIGAGAVGALAALFLLLQAVVSWLVIAGLPEQWGYSIVGILVAGVAAAVLSKGINNLKASKVMPERTLEQLKADFATVKEHVQ